MDAFPVSSTVCGTLQVLKYLHVCGIDALHSDLWRKCHFSVYNWCAFLRGSLGSQTSSDLTVKDTPFYRFICWTHSHCLDVLRVPKPPGSFLSQRKDPAFLTKSLGTRRGDIQSCYFLCIVSALRLGAVSPVSLPEEPRKTCSLRCLLLKLTVLL